jgi:hypothetical protein
VALLGTSLGFNSNPTPLRRMDTYKTWKDREC